MKRFYDFIHKYKQGDYSSRFYYSRRNKFGAIVSAFNELMDAVDSNTHQLEQRKLELEAIAANIPGGVHRCSMDNGYEFKFVSQSYLKLIGYSREEILTVFQNKFINTVYEKDRQRVVSQIDHQLQFSDAIEIEYRMVHSDGRLLWILDKRQVIVDPDGIPWFYSVLVDITTTKMAQEELRQSEERFRIILEQTDDIIIEWDLISDKLIFSSNWNKISSIQPLFEHASATLVNPAYIHPEDIKQVEELIRLVYYEHKNTMVEFRIKQHAGNYIWVKARVSVITDQNNIPIKAIGILSDISLQKQEIEHLKAAAQTDPLTGLYNKRVAQMLIDEIISKDYSNVNHALIILDIDNFKSINDHMGHLIGDLVISDVATSLKNSFRSTDIIGRIGGDEFIIFIRDLSSHDHLENKLESIRLAFSSISLEKSFTKITGSMGVSFFPQDGKTYYELLRKADIGLYHAKNNGKNQYCIYHPSIGGFFEPFEHNGLNETDIHN